MSSFDNKVQCDSCGGYFHERSMTFEDLVMGSSAMCVTCWDEGESNTTESARPMAEEFMRRLSDNGYTIIQTGGGCTAFAKNIGLNEILITQDASHKIYLDDMRDVGVVIGVYPDELEGQHLFFVNPTHTNWDMIYGLVEQAESVARALDGIQALQKIEA